MSFPAALLQYILLLAAVVVVSCAQEHEGSKQNDSPYRESIPTTYQASSRRSLAGRKCLTLEEMILISTSENDIEFDVADGIERAEELWLIACDVMFDKAVEAEKVGNRYPFVLCIKSPDKSGFKRRQEVLDYLDAGDASDYEFTVLYNNENATCYYLEMFASTAIDLTESPVVEAAAQPLCPTMKMRAGLVASLLKLADDDNMEDISETDTVPSNSTLDVILCAGLDETTVNEIGTIITAFLKGNFTWESTIYSNFTSLTGSIPDRTSFWETVYDLGINSEEGCDNFVDRLQSTIIPAGNDTSLGVGVSLSLAPDDEADTTVTLACVLSLVSGLSYMDEVCSIQLSPVFETTNKEGQWIVMTGKEDDRSFWDAGVTGSGQVVAVSDTGLDVDNCYFRNSGGDINKNGDYDAGQRKVVQYIDYADDRDDELGHGTHVCGSIAGKIDTGGEGEADGVAKNAKLALIDVGVTNSPYLSIPTDVNELLGTGRGQGALLHSASWGSSNQQYDSRSRDIDRYLSDDFNFLMIVAAGNEGDGNQARSVLSPALAKNVLTVGASQSFGDDLTQTQGGIDYLASFSSRGPTRDNRRKPDVVAPGQSILSAAARNGEKGECDEIPIPSGGKGNNGGLLYLQGTSMATPITAGAAALVREYFLAGYYPDGEKGKGPRIDPTGPLVKAVLIHGGQTIDRVNNGFGMKLNEYDNNQGFGRVNLVESLPLKSRNTFSALLIDRESVNDGNEYKTQVNITSGINNGCIATELRATLVWADPAGSTGCTKCLVNDLDLTITDDKRGTVYYPNGLSGRDDLNNVERIVVKPENGDIFTIKVRAANLDRDKQVFAVYVTGCIGEGGGRIGSEETSGASNPFMGVFAMVAVILLSAVTLLF